MKKLIYILFLLYESFVFCKKSKTLIEHSEIHKKEVLFPNNITNIIETDKKSEKFKNNIPNITKATTTIFLSGLFDKSFFITAFLAMKYSKWIVIGSTTSALSLIGILSVYLGITINQYIPVIWIDIFAIFLFFLFGFNMIYEGFIMDELERTEIKLENNNNHEGETNNNLTDEKNNCNSNPICDCQIEKKYFPEENANHENRILNDEKLEKKICCSKKEKIPIMNIISHQSLTQNNISQKINPENLVNSTKQHEESNNKKNQILSKIFCNPGVNSFWKVFFLIFFSEIGDRSQISTIYLTTNFHKFSIIIAVIISSLVLTIIAVFGGRMIANKISEKKLTIFAGWVFVVFGFVAIYLLFQTENIIEVNNQNNFLAKDNIFVSGNNKMKQVIH